MLGLGIFLVIFLLLLLLLCTPLKICVQYDHPKTKFSIRFWGVTFPKPNTSKKPEEPAPSPKKKPEQVRQQWKQWKAFWREGRGIVFRALRCLTNHVVIENLSFSYHCGFDDAVTTALMYGSVSGVFYNIYAYLQRHFTVKETNVTILPDFQQERYDIQAEGIATVRLVYIIIAGICLLPLVKIIKKQGGVENGRASDSRVDGHSNAEH